MLNRRAQILTVDQFFADYEETEERYELIDGVPYMMAGGTVSHARIAGNLLFALRRKLDDGPCEPFGSDMGLRLDLTNLRYPDVAVYCDPADLGPESANERGLRYPSVIFEVLSPSTAAFDRGGKVAEYQQLASVRTIVLVEPGPRRLEVHERTGADAWRKFVIDDGTVLELGEPRISLTMAEIFGS